MTEPIRKVPMTLTVTQQILDDARADFIAIMGMTPEEAHLRMADDLARAFDHAVQEGEA